MILPAFASLTIVAGILIVLWQLRPQPSTSTVDVLGIDLVITWPPGWSKRRRKRWARKLGFAFADVISVGRRAGWTDEQIAKLICQRIGGVN